METNGCERGIDSAKCFQLLLPDSLQALGFSSCPEMSIYMNCNDMTTCLYGFLLPMGNRIIQMMEKIN